MIRLELPASLHESKDLWKKMSGRKHEPVRASLAGMALRVFRRFDEYLPKVLSLSPGTWSSSERGHLSDCFNSGRGSDEQIVAVARRVSTRYCPYCGLPLLLRPRGSWHESDHFLPISVFPEFGAFAQNLVVCCHDCNFAKGTKVEINGVRCFLHPYFDDCLRQSLLSVEVTDAGDGVPLVTFRLEARRAGVLADVAARHAEILDVCARAQDFVIERLAKSLALVADSSDASAGLANLAAPILAKRPNDPEGLTLKAASESDALPKLLEASRGGAKRLRRDPAV